MQYIQLDDESRVTAWMESDENPNDAFWLESPWDAIPDDFSDYLIIDGELIHDPRDLPPAPYGAEQVLSAMFNETDALDALPDSTLAHMAPYMPEWDGGAIAYEVGDKVRYLERPYRCLQAHTSKETWNPQDAVSLWARILANSDTIPEWEQPDSTNPYMKGDRVTHSGKSWESLIDNNVWEPGAPGTEALWRGL